MQPSNAPSLHTFAVTYKLPEGDFLKVDQLDVLDAGGDEELAALGVAMALARALDALRSQLLVLLEVEHGGAFHLISGIYDDELQVAVRCNCDESQAARIYTALGEEVPKAWEAAANGGAE